MTGTESTLPRNRVRVRIHRGAHEVGGSCVELAYQGVRLVVDLGLPLDSKAGEAARLPAIPGLLTPDPSLMAVIISHGHPDHWGLTTSIGPHVPIIAGKVTSAVLREAAFFATGTDLRPIRYLTDHKPLAVGPFTVTPYLVDHSAYDAYALLIEAGGRRLFYSGDLRGHGRRRRLTDALIDHPPLGVHALLLEGTHVRPRRAPDTPTEEDVEDACSSVMTSTGGLVLVAYSPQNIDRLCTLHRAARRAGRVFVMDLYAATIAAASADPQVPQYDWDDVAVYVPQSQRIKVKTTGEFARVDRVRNHRVFAEQIAADPGHYALTFRGSMTREVAARMDLDHASAIWSMWAGYLDDPSGRRTTAWLAARRIALHQIHASGHASIGDLQRLAGAIDAEVVVPIHTNHPELFETHFDGVVRHNDGAEWTV